MKQLIIHSVVAVTIMTLVTSCSVQTNPVTGQSRLLAYSWSQEIQIGQEVDQELIAVYGLYEDENVANYIDELGHELLEVSHMRREDTDRQFRETEFFFRVLDDPVVNAFALPGGYVYVTRGLMAHLNNEAQLAVVIGHEIGHVAARHASQRALQQTIGQVVVIGGAVLGQELLGLPGENILNLSSVAAQLLFLSYSRDAERESDRLGVEYSAMTGHAAEEGAEFFTSLKRLGERRGQSIPNMLATHPDPGEREKNIPRMAAEWREKGYEQNIYNTDRYNSILEGMIYGQNPREGYVEDDMFLHPELEFSFPVPPGWQVINQRQQVVLVDPSDQAVMIFRIDSEAQSARGSVQSFTAQDGITVNAGPEELVSSGRYQGARADVNIQMEDGTLRAIVHSIEFDNRIYRFINYTAANNFGDFEEVFLNIPRNFDRVTDERILNISPVVLNIIQVDEPTPFRDLLPSTFPMDIDIEEIAIINQVHLDDVIEPGQYVKIPVQ